MKAAYCLSLLAALASAAPMHPRGLLDLDLNLCLDLSLLGLVNIDINSSSCSAKYPVDRPYPATSGLCSKLAKYGISPAVLHVDCSDTDVAPSHENHDHDYN
ncbi:hypothetical protein H4R21_005330, partial [Coemansia helicoidea]